MALESVNQYGATYVFGSPKDADAPVITGMKVRKVQVKFEPEVMEKSAAPEGGAESLTVTKADQRMHTATFTGPITNADDLAATEDFSWNDRFWVITSGNDGREPGKYAEASIEALSHYGIEGPADEEDGGGA